MLCKNEMLQKFRNRPALELSKRPALIVLCAGASPLMRERRINNIYDASAATGLQGWVRSFDIRPRSLRLNPQGEAANADLFIRLGHCALFARDFAAGD